MSDSKKNNLNKENIEGNETSFLEKVKNALIKFFKGLKNFIVKTGRVNGTHCYGVIDNIGDFLVYDDHALISAVGMDDVTFTSKNVISYSFEGLGKLRRNKVHVKYKITLDDDVVFPEKVRQKNDVKNLDALIDINMDSKHLLSRFENYASYKYDDCIIIVFNLKRQVGNREEAYQEAISYSLPDILLISEGKGGSFIIKFKDKKEYVFSPVNEKAREVIKELM